MSDVDASEQVLRRFRQEVGALYGDRLERVVLFGSRARGDSREDSDYDIAVFIRTPDELWDELGRLSHVTTRILDETGAIVSASPFPAGAWREQSPLMREIREDGLDL